MSKEFSGQFTPITDFHFSYDSLIPTEILRESIATDVKAFGGKPQYQNLSGYEYSNVSPIDIFDTNKVFTGSTFEVKKDETGEITKGYILKPIVTDTARDFFQSVINESGTDLSEKSKLTLFTVGNMPYIEFEGREKGISLNLPFYGYMQRIGGKTLTFADGESTVQDQTHFLTVKEAVLIKDNIESGDIQEPFYSEATYPFNTERFPEILVGGLGSEDLVAVFKIINYDSDTIYTIIEDAVRQGKFNEQLLRTIANVVLDIRPKREELLESDGEKGESSF